MILICTFLLLGLSACGSLSASEKPVSGRYYLTILPDKKGKNTVERVEDVMLRLKAGGGLVREEKGNEQEGRWEVSKKSITLKLGREKLTGSVSEDRIEIGDAVYIRGLKEARDLWQADADAYVADPLAEYEGKYYLAGRLEEGQNRVSSVDDTTLWLMPDHEALLFEKGKLSLLRWDVQAKQVQLVLEDETRLYAFTEGTITAAAGNYTDTWFRERDEAAAYLAAHPTVPKPHVPVFSGLEGEYFLAYATAFGQVTDIGKAGVVRLGLAADYALRYEGPGYSQEGSYEIQPDGQLVLTFTGGYLKGSAQNGCLDFTNIAGDRFVFFDSLERADVYYHLCGIPAALPEQTDPAEPTIPTETTAAVPESSTADPESAAAAAFWQGTWYGLVRLNKDCSGIYFLMRGKCYTVYVTLSMREDGSGTLVVYDPAANFAERLLSGTVCCGENKTLLLTEGVIEPVSYTIGGYSAAWDEEQQLLTMHLTQSLTGGSIGGELYLRPWGQTWEDQPELMKQLPDYQAYLEEIKTGTPRYRAD